VGQYGVEDSAHKVVAQDEQHSQNQVKARPAYSQALCRPAIFSRRRMDGKIGLAGAGDGVSGIEGSFSRIDNYLNIIQRDIDKINI